MLIDVHVDITSRQRRVGLNEIAEFRHLQHQPLRRHHGGDAFENLAVHTGGDPDAQRAGGGADGIGCASLGDERQASEAGEGKTAGE